MKPQTHIKLQLREIIDNWRYIDAILFMAILLIYVGFTDPCDRCLVKYNGVEQTCKEAFYNSIGYNVTDYGIHKIDEQKIVLNLTNFTIKT